MSLTYSSDLHSEQLEDAITQLLAQASAQQPPLSIDPADIDRLRAFLAVSPYLRQLSTRLPELFLGLPGATPAALDDGTGEPPALASEAQEQAWLRRHRHSQLTQILWHDLDGGASLWQTLERLSALADRCVRLATDWAHARLAARYGEPRDAEGRAQRLVVLGMGKLGGCELNVSSDIDLIYLFPENGSTDGRRQIDNSEFFRRVGQGLTRLLSAITEDGFVYRVDTRLRPFGESGPLAISFDALEHYLLTQARTWERYAMVKARAVTGEPADIKALESLLRPFVYRRYLDYNAIDALRDLKRKIMQSVREKGLEDNIKLGAGGIREAEFIVQSFQLVRGGREPRLRERSVARALPQLAALGLLSEAEVSRLHDAYVFLRRVENAVQTLRDQQTHSVPDDALDRLRLVTMLGFADWDSLRQAIDEQRQWVAGQFTELFSEDDATQADRQNPAGVARDAWERFISGSAERTDEWLTRLGIEPVDGLLDALADLCRGAFYQRLHASAQRRVDRILPQLLTAVPAAADGADTSRGTLLLRCARFVRAVAGRSGYLQVLADHPEALARLVGLFAHSAWIAGFVTRHPIVLDELVGPTANRPLPDRTRLMAEVAAEAERVAAADIEQQMDALRQYRNAHVLHVACAEIDGRLGIMQVSDQLSWLAEALLQAVLMLVTPALEARFGRPACRLDGRLHHPQIGIVAYGKLGGYELGYGSDLDLVFLHDSAGTQQQTDGARSIDNSVYYARLTKAVVTFMSTRTQAGVLYEVDTRLRPNGRSGLLVSALDAFADYQTTQAWTWEHQALVRARPVAGSASLQATFVTVRERVLSTPREHDPLLADVVSMRQRMRDELANSTAGQMDLKHDRGGVVDIEFLVQFLVLAHAARHPELLAYTDNIRLLEVLEQAGLLAPEAADSLRQCYRDLRARLHRQALRLESGPVRLDAELDALRERVGQLTAPVIG